MSSQDEIVVAGVNGNIAHGHRRQIAGKLRPLPSAVDRDKQPELGPKEKQIAIYPVFANHMRIAFDCIRGEPFPGLSEVGGLKHIDLHIAGLVAIECCVGGSTIETTGLDCRAPGVLWQPLDIADYVFPSLSAVARA